MSVFGCVTWKEGVQPANAHGILCCQCLLIVVCHLIGHVPQWHRPQDLPSSSLSTHCESLLHPLETVS